MAEEGFDPLASMNLKEFAREAASESPAPGGGSVAAYCGAMGAALGTMVANLSAHKRGWDDKWEEYSSWAEKGQLLVDELLFLVDEDTRSFDRIMQAFQLPKGDQAQLEARKEAIADATRTAIQVPLRVMEVCADAMPLMHVMAEKGLKASVSDAGVGAMCARTGALGAYLNVLINCATLDDPAFVEQARNRANELKAIVEEEERSIVALTIENI